MRTTDLLVVGLFSPAAIAAVGLANLYSNIALWTGTGLGTGALALSSQDMGSGAVENRDQAVSQALLIGFLIGIPIAVLAIVFNELALRVFSAPPEVVTLGASYLAIVLATAPARHVSLIGEKSMQGLGDTRTPMYIRSGENLLNIVGTVGLGLGLGPLPRLEVIGVALSTAFANTAGAVVIMVLLYRGYTEISLVRTADWTITTQLVSISAPRTIEGLSRMAATFPLNILIVSFSVEAYAGYQIGRRVFQQITGPLERSFNVVASILTGKSIGDQLENDIRVNTTSIATLGVITIGVLAVVLYVTSVELAGLFSSDQTTVELGGYFVQAFAISATATGLSRIYAGALQGSGETKKPFIAELTGTALVLLGTTYVVGVYFSQGVTGLYVGIILYAVWKLAVLYYWYRQDHWILDAIDRMEARGSLETE
jgi:putative MATE family efflux protein